MALKRQLTLLALEVATAVDRTSETQLMNTERGIVIHVSLANIAAGSFTPRLEWATLGGDFLAIWTAAAALAANGNHIYQLYPGALGGDFIETVGISIPRIVRFVLARGAGTADTLVEADTLS